MVKLLSALCYDPHTAFIPYTGSLYHISLIKGQHQLDDTTKDNAMNNNNNDNNKKERENGIAVITITIIRHPFQWRMFCLSVNIKDNHFDFFFPKFFRHY